LTPLAPLTPLTSLRPLTSLMALAPFMALAPLTPLTPLSPSCCYARRPRFPLSSLLSRRDNDPTRSRKSAGSTIPNGEHRKSDEGHGT
jgi:hypothetical protein